MTTRREFLKDALIAGAMLSPISALGQMRGRGRGRAPISESEIPAYRYKIIPLSQGAGLKADFEKIKAGDGYSRNGVFRAAMNALDFGSPAGFPESGSIIILATFAKSAVADFTMNGSARRILIPFQYFSDDWTSDKLMDVLQKDLIKDPGRRIVDISKRVPLKYLAGRSGLGTIGRNNLVYVEGMGSNCLLHAFATDAPLPGDALGEMELLGECRHCHACINACPTDAMGSTRFLIDAGRCISLFNENPGEFPNWILPSMHHALMGCMKCQDVCPENRRIPELVVTLEPVSEAETKTILKGRPDDAFLAALRKKQRLFPAVSPADFLPILKRNLGVLIRA